MSKALVDEYLRADQPWGRGRVVELVRAVQRVMVLDEVVEVDTDGVYGLRCAAVDHGRPELVLDAIQLEQGIDLIEDPRVRAAVILCIHGFDDADIGALLGGRGRSSPGTKLIERGIGVLTDFTSGRLV